MLFLKSLPASRPMRDGFKWPDYIGAIVEAPDWNPSPVCGNGLHGLAMGSGDASLLCWDSDAVWYVFESIDAYSIGSDQDVVGVDEDKSKCRRAIIRAVGKRWDVTPYLVNRGAIGVHGAVFNGGSNSAYVGGVGSYLAGGDHAALTAEDISTLTGGDYCTLVGGQHCSFAAGSSARIICGHRSIVTAGAFLHAIAASSCRLTGGESSRLVGGYGSSFRAGHGTTFVASDTGVTAVVGEGNIEPYVTYKSVGGFFTAVEE